MEEILKKFESIYLDKEIHKWRDDSEMYGGITYGEFKQIFRHLIQSCDTDTTEYEYILEDKK